MSAAPSPTWSCSTRRPARSAPPRSRPTAATRPSASCSGLQILRRQSPPSASIVHGTTVGTNALLERKGARVGHHHHDRLPRRARDAPPRPPPHLGPVGRFRPRGRPRHAASRSHERTLADGSIRQPVDPAEPCRPWPATSCRTGAEALAIVFINAYANPANETGGPGRGRIGLAQRQHRLLQRRSCLRSASSNAPPPPR